MTDALEVVGLVSLVVMGFLIAIWLGFGLIGAGCLWASWSLTAKRRRALEAEAARRAARLVRT